MVDWWRSWHGAPTDPKWLAIAKRADTSPAVVAATAWALFDYASQHADRGSIAGFDPESYAIWAGTDQSVIEAVLLAMADKGIIRDGRLANWEKRQPKREDSSAGRVRAFRERRNVSDTDETKGNADVTQRNAGDDEETLDKRRGDTDTDTDTEKMQSETPARARARRHLQEFHLSEDQVMRIFDHFPTLSDDRIAVEADACRSYFETTSRRTVKDHYLTMLNWLKRVDEPQAVTQPDDDPPPRDRDAQPVRYFDRAAYDKYEAEEEAHYAASRGEIPPPHPARSG